MQALWEVELMRVNSAMGRRIITTENLEEDVKIENHLRPQMLVDYIGQGKNLWTMYFSMALRDLERRRLQGL